jgi:8-oxo-dGTP pyrophosphatase MutT (NUDIX family)
MWSAPGSESSKRLGSSGIPDTVWLVWGRVSDPSKPNAARQLAEAWQLAIHCKLSTMPREISAGGVVLRQVSGVWHVALIEPQKSEPQRETPKPATAKTPRKRSRAVFALPKGLVDPGEKPQAAAVREVREETGIGAEPVTKLSDNKYVYVRTWGDGKRVFKIVSFYLMRYVSGEIDNLTSDMRIEVKQALWVPLADAPRQLAYSNERKVLRQAQDYLESHGLS